jgi:hypothetical protein
MRGKGAATRSVSMLATAVLVFWLVPAVAANGVTFEQVARLHAFDSATNDYFGASVDIDGDTAAVGSPHDDSERGAVYVYTRSTNGWALHSKLFAPVRTPGDWYGQSVAISGDVLVVSAPGRQVSGYGMSGAVFIYRRVGGVWGLPYTIEDPAPHIDDRFGTCVDVDAGTVVVGEPGMDDALGTNHGMAHIYAWTGSAWALQDWVYDSDPGAENRLGSSVAICGNTVAVGSPGEDSYTGSVCVATRSGTSWTQSPKLYAPSPWPSDSFGNAVAVSGTTVVVGAYSRDLPYGTDAGSAYIFTNPGGGWAIQATLQSPVADEWYLFGSAVDIDGGTVVIGESQVAEGKGAAYVYRRTGTTWTRVQDLNMAIAGPAQQFGCSVAVSNGTAIIGASQINSPSMPFAGGAFIYSHLAPVYRFYNPGAGTHFFTDSAEERDHVIATWPTIYSYEGVAYKVNPENNPQPLYRFYKPSSSSHFYTASLDEANHVLATWPHIYSYDGPTFAVTPWPEPAKPPVYRFYNKVNGSHFYTASLDEANHVIATWPQVYTYEGQAFWLGQ